MAIVEQAEITLDPAAVQKPVADSLSSRNSTADDDGRDVVLERALRMLDPEVARSFTSEQRRAIRTMLDLRFATEHLIDLRRGFNVSGRRYFLAFLLGRERRRLRRSKSEGVAGWLQDHATLLIAGAALLTVVFCIAALLRG